MTTLAFQELLPTPPPEEPPREPAQEDLLGQFREAVEDSVASAAEESAGFVIDIGASLVSIAWVAGIVVVAIWLGKKIRRWFTRRAMARWPTKPNRATLLDQVLQVVFVVLAVLFSMRIMGVSSNSVVTSIGIILGALSIALQDVLKNLVAGMYLLVEEPFRRGDRLVIPGADGGQDGWVENTRMRVTELRNPQRELMLIPNYILFSEIVINRTDEEPYALNLRLLMIDAQPEQVEHDIREVVQGMVGPDYTAPAIFLMGAGPLGTAADVRIWFDPDSGLRREVIVAIHERFPGAILEVVSG